MSDLLRTNVYIDASNLFYGGEKSLGWKVDYAKLFRYFYGKYGASRVFFFGGIETCGYLFDYLDNSSVSVEKIETHLTVLLDKRDKGTTSVESDGLSRHLGRTRFYLKLASFGYELILKPVKTFVAANGSITRKANCDVDMAFYMITDQDMFDRAVVLSGDGDFLPVLKHLRDNGKEILVLARASRTAKEIRRFAGGQFRDFDYLRTHIEFSNDRPL